jgi:uncharacterized protein (TIGR04255 family)
MLKAAELKEPVSNTSSPQKLTVYREPPVTEVVCSVLFQSIEALLTPHIGILWQRFQPDYPLCEDVPPLAPNIEVFNSPTESILQLTNIPPLPRVWFIRADQTSIIQIQRDRFIHNWRKTKKEDNYPRYEEIIKTFQEHINNFNLFLKEANLGEVQPKQYELTYINRIPQGQEWSSLEDIGNIFPDFSWRKDTQRFLHIPKSASWETTFDLPNQLGRLHTTVNNDIDSNGLSVLSFELTVRGIGTDQSFTKTRDWFDIAHEWIVRAFSDLTGEKIQTDIWQRLE